MLLHASSARLTADDAILYVSAPEGDTPVRIPYSKDAHVPLGYGSVLPPDTSA